MSDHDPYAPQLDPVSFESTDTQSAPAAPSEAETPSEEPVPKGTSAEVLAWTGDDKGRAQRALEAEESTNRPRKGLVEELEEIITK